MILTRFVAQLDYEHNGPRAECEQLATDLFRQLKTLAGDYPGLEVVVVGFADVNEDADAPPDHSEGARRHRQGRRDDQRRGNGHEPNGLRRVV